VVWPPMAEKKKLYIYIYIVFLVRVNVILNMTRAFGSHH
jgi:hypothetical protein